jgi:hypothetical protein
MSVHTIDNVRLIISEACSTNIKLVVVLFTKDDAPYFLSAVGLPQLYFNKLQIKKGHIANTVLTVVHKSITDPKFNRCALQKQLNWKDWLMTEWIQLENYAKQNIFAHLALYPLTHPYSSGYECIPSRPVRMIARKCEASITGQLTEVTKWSMAQLIHLLNYSHSRTPLCAPARTHG